MPLYQAIILAIVQGLTEFLPVSSTAHLAIIPQLLHWKDPGLAFDIALHVGTLAAVLIFFFKDWVRIVLTGLGIPFAAAGGGSLSLQRIRGLSRGGETSDPLLPRFPGASPLARRGVRSARPH